MNRYILPVLLLILSVGISVTHWVALENFLYWKYPWLDIHMHFFGGIFVGLAALWLLYRSGWININQDQIQKLDIYTASLLTVLIVGLVWEVFEFSVDTLFTLEGSNNQGDTLLDLVMDTLGALMAAVIVAGGGLYKIENNNHKKNG